MTGKVLPLRKCASADVHGAEVAAVARLRRARFALGWSQERLAQELGKHEHSVRRWEAGKVALPAWALVAVERLADRLTGRAAA